MSVDPLGVIQWMLGGGAIFKKLRLAAARSGQFAAIWGIGGIGIANGLGSLLMVTFIAVMTFLILTLFDRL